MKQKFARQDAANSALYGVIATVVFVVTALLTSRNVGNETVMGGLIIGMVTCAIAFAWIRVSKNKSG